jgi:hypothetical protein
MGPENLELKKGGKCEMSHKETFCNLHSLHNIVSVVKRMEVEMDIHLGRKFKKKSN